MSSTIGLVGILYVVISGNFVGDLLSCDTQRVFTHSLLAKHMIILLGSLFWVAEAVDAERDSFLQIITKTFAIYFLFFISTKSKWWILVPFFAMISIDQVLRIYEKKTIKKKANANTLKQVAKARTVVQTLGILLLVAGAVTYALKQKRDHGKFHVWDFITGSKTCRGV